jgi:hypothetical protein
MKRAILVVVVVALIATLAFAASPLVALLHLKKSAVARDPQALAEYVDFPQLRINLLTHVNTKIEQKNDGRLFGEIRSEIAQKFVDAKLEEVTTPQAVIGLMCDQDPRSEKPPGTPCNLRKPKLLGMGFKSMDMFYVTAKREDKPVMTLVIQRKSGLSWQLVDLIQAAPAP